MKPRIPEVVKSAVEFHAYKNHIVAIFPVGQSTIGIRFESPEQLLEFFNRMMEKAVVVWPDNEWIKEYLQP